MATQTQTLERSTETTVGTPRLWGLMAEFDNVDDAYNAAKAARLAGYNKFDLHSPFPIHGIDDAIGIRKTILPWIVLVGGLTGLAGGFLLTWWTNASNLNVPIFDNLRGYQYLISGKPIWSFQANLPVLFETTVLLAALSAVFGMLLLNKLPLLSQPLLANDRFRRVTNDRFFLVIQADDEQFDEPTVRQFMQQLEPISIEAVEDNEP